MIKQLYAYALLVLILTSSYLMGMSQQEKNKALDDAVKDIRQIELVNLTFGALATKMQCIQRLIHDGAEPSYAMYTATASYKGTAESTSVLRLLLDCKALVEEETALGTPLMCAVNTCNFNAATLLLKKGASPKVGERNILRDSIIKIYSKHSINTISDTLALTALLINHHAIETADITRMYTELTGHIPNLDRARQLAYCASAQAIKKELTICRVLTRDTEGIVAAYAGCYHDIKEHPLEEDELYAEHKVALEKITAAILF